MVENTRSTTNNQVLPHWLFGIYILEISNFFKTRFKGFKVNATQDDTTDLQVFFGTPSAAFRAQEKINNGKVLLPTLNFYMFEATRNLLKTRPVMLTSQESIDKTNGTIEMMRVPTHFDLTLSFNLYTKNYRERDY